MMTMCQWDTVTARDYEGSRRTGILYVLRCQKCREIKDTMIAV